MGKNGEGAPLTGSLKGVGGLKGQLATTQLYAPYMGEHCVIPQAGVAQTLNTANKIVYQDIEVLEIPYFETSNTADGMTVYIAKEVSHGD